jgi:MoxR-like ATPase
MEGTYPLPEAQLDRFMFKIFVPSPDEDELIEIARRTTGGGLAVVQKAADGEALLAMQRLASEAPVEERVYRYAARLVTATHVDSPAAPDSVRRHLRVGVSPRGMQALIKAAKVEALLEGRKAAAIDDIRRVAYPSLRHRLVLNFEAQAEGVSADAIIKDVLEKVGAPA